MQGFLAFLKSLGAARLAAMVAVALTLTGFFTFLMAGEKPTISMAEHDRRSKDAEAIAYRNGFAAAQAAANADATQRIAAALATIGEVIERMGRGLDGVEARLEIEAVQVAVAGKLAPALVASRPYQGRPVIGTSEDGVAPCDC